MSAYVRRKEIFELVDAKWCIDIFLGGNPRNRRLMKLDIFGNIMQHQRFHGAISVFKKASLDLHNAGGDPEQRIIPLL